MRLSIFFLWRFCGCGCHKDPYDNDLSHGSIFDVFQAVYSCAREMASLESQRHWGPAARQIIRAMRRVEVLLNRFWLEDVTSSSLPTTQPHRHDPHVQSITDETSTQEGAEPEEIAELATSQRILVLMSYLVVSSLCCLTNQTP